MSRQSSYAHRRDLGNASFTTPAHQMPRQMRKRKSGFDTDNYSSQHMKRQRLSSLLNSSTNNLYHGKIKKLCEKQESKFGFIQPKHGLEESPESPDCQDIYFSMKCYSGLFALAPNDEVSYFVRRKQSNIPSYAYNVRLIKCNERKPDIIDAHIKTMLELTYKCQESSSDNDEQLLGAISCSPVWQCVGNCIDKASNKNISVLVKFLIELDRVKIMQRSLTSLLETLLQSELFRQSKDFFRAYVKRVVDSSSACELEHIQQLIFIMIKLVPRRSKQLVALISPICNQEHYSWAHFVYKLLRQVVKSSKDSIETAEWNELPLAPSVAELSSDELDIFESLRPVVPRGPYSSAEDYLDIYFRLLRADCFASLRKGVLDLLQHRLDPRDMNVYYGVQLAGIHVSDAGMLIGLHVNSPTTVDFNKSSQLMFGNLICISITGTFQDPIWATVINRDLLKKHKLVIVELCTEINSETDAKTVVALKFTGPKTVVAETPTYYKAYQPVLKSLQQLCAEDLVFQRELIHCECGGSPEYIAQDSHFDRAVLHPQNWPVMWNNRDPRLLGKNPPDCNGDNETDWLPACQNELVHCTSPEYHEMPTYVDSDCTTYCPWMINSVTGFGEQCFSPHNPETELNAISYSVDESQFQSTVLDTSQEQAIKHCLRHRVAIVQGPPGTGKTYVGLKLTQLILSMSSCPSSPILVITYKNHALDEFLKGIRSHFRYNHKMFDKIARVGGRSKDQSLHNCNLSALRNTIHMSDGSFHHFATELDAIREKLYAALCDMDKLTCFSVEVLLRCLNKSHIVMFLKNCNWFHAEVKQFSDACENSGSYRRYVRRQNVMDFIKRFEPADPDTLDVDLYSELQHLLQGALNLWLPKKELFTKFENDYSHQTYKTKCSVNTCSRRDEENNEFDPATDETQKERMASSSYKVKKAEEILQSMHKFQNLPSGNSHLLKVAREVFTNCSLNSILLSVEHIWELTDREKIQLIQCALYENYETSDDRLQKLLTEFDCVLRKKTELENMHDAKIMRKMKVVGMTVTGANIRRKLIEHMRPEVVLVEEAAEIVESQLIPILGNWTKHLILIGDHKQLRPAVENHRIANEYHLNISMMERLINNGLPYSTLAMQNRMRPEFAELLLSIYPDLKSNIDVVQNNKQANCIRHSMYFWDRKQPEISERSFTNQDEADCAVNLALFLIEHGYKPQQITILTPYLGQVKLIRSKIRSNVQRASSTLSDEQPELTPETCPQVHTIDTYQGEENDFIIITLVRSNPQGNIGFLTQLGRRCVAQSRARCGLYFIGNRETLSRHDKWRTLIDAMAQKDCVGSAIPLNCPDHPLLTHILAKTAAGIPLSQSFCKQKCNSKFPCNEHACFKECQPRHQHNICEHIVNFTCSKCSGKRVKMCHEDETSLQCKNQVRTTFSSCGHIGRKMCYQNENEVKCKQKCRRMLSCSHPCENVCSITCEVSSCKLCAQIREGEAKQLQEAEEQRIRIIKKLAKITISEIRQRNVEDNVSRQNLPPDAGASAEFSSIEDRVTRFFDRFQSTWQPRVFKVEQITNLKLEIEWLKCQSKMFDPTRKEQQLYLTDKQSAETTISSGIPWDGDWKTNNFLCTNVADYSIDWKPSKSEILIMFDVLIGKSIDCYSIPKDMTRTKLKSDKLDSLSVFYQSTKTGTALRKGFILYNLQQAIPRYLVHFEAVDSCYCISQLERRAMVLSDLTHHHIPKPKRSCDNMVELEVHFRTAESQFLRLTTTCKRSVESVDLYLNPPLLKNFYDKQRSFKTEYGMDSEESKYILAFHGTGYNNFESIVNTNFDINRLSANTGSDGKYGAGIYFSEFPEFSMKYGKGNKLLLCKILPGKTYDCPETMLGASLQSGYDSHRAKADREGRGQELVIFNADQILPCYVINYC